jgi:hypothetical protein
VTSTASRNNSGGYGEAAGPGHLLLRGQGDLQETERLQHAGAAQGAGIDGCRPAAVTTSASSALASVSSPAIRTVAGTSPVVR